MDDPNTVPPQLQSEAPPPPLPEQPPAVSRWRWWLHLLILSAFPVLTGLASLAFSSGKKGGTLLPTNTITLLTTVFFELFVTGVIFLFAWLASRANAEQLLLKWRGGFGPIWRGLVYSIGLRVGIFLIVLCIMLPALIAGGGEAFAARLRPEVENLVNADALRHNPVYLLINLTLVSFVLAGLREELWRAGMLAGLVALFPKGLGSTSGKLAAVTIAAVIFGLGHLSQGWGGVALTALLGVGLGAIMIWRRSVWEAVLAHGFFDATSFLALCVISK